MEECKGCKFDLIYSMPRDAGELVSIMNTCLKCKRAYEPEYAHEYRDLYEESESIPVHN